MTMRSHTLIVLGAVLSVTFSFAHAQSDAPAEPLSRWYRQPAAQWEEALPVGNGRLGAMVFGTVDRERIQLNEETIWAGNGAPPIPVEQGKSLPEIRRLLFEGKYT